MKEKSVFREDGKTLLNVRFTPRCNRKPASIEVIFKGPSKDKKRKATMFTLEGKSFGEQYRRAVDAIADFHGIAPDDPLRVAMELTSTEFLRHYGLKTRVVTYEEAVLAEPHTGEIQ